MESKRRVTEMVTRFFDVFLSKTGEAYYNEITLQGIDIYENRKEQKFMIEFGEKLKQVREDNGMTQETLAGRLYVTRQAVSRWECGARYPDLLTTKKIAEILGVTIDELVSGEELQKNIEREPVLAKPVPNIIQTVLYAIAAAAYLLMSIFVIKSLFPDEALKGTPAGKVNFIAIVVVIRTLLCFAAVAAGLIFSMKNTLTPKRTGWIMSAYYGIAAVEFVCTFIDMQIHQNGYMPWTGWIEQFGVYFISFVCIILFFRNGKCRIPAIVIYAVAALSAVTIAVTIKIGMNYMTDLGFVVRTVGCMGRIGLVVLLVYQTHVFSKKIKLGVSHSV